MNWVDSTRTNVARADLQYEKTVRWHKETAEGYVTVLVVVLYRIIIHSRPGHATLVHSSLSRKHASQGKTYCRSHKKRVGGTSIGTVAQRARWALGLRTGKVTLAANNLDRERPDVVRLV